MFRNEYVAEREEKKAVMEQHVRLSNAVISSAETKGYFKIIYIKKFQVSFCALSWDRSS